VAHFPEFDALASKSAAGGTTWHRSITSREAQINRREALGVRRMSLVVPRVSLIETSDPPRSTCAAISVACDSTRKARAPGPRLAEQPVLDAGHSVRGVVRRRCHAEGDEATRDERYRFVHAGAKFDAQPHVR